MILDKITIRVVTGKFGRFMAISVITMFFFQNGVRQLSWILSAVNLDVTGSRGRPVPTYVLNLVTINSKRGRVMAIYVFSWRPPSS